MDKHQASKARVAAGLQIPPDGTQLIVNRVINQAQAQSLKRLDDYLTDELGE
jgi:hypothetical protein